MKLYLYWILQERTHKKKQNKFYILFRMHMLRIDRSKGVGNKHLWLMEKVSKSVFQANTDHWRKIRACRDHEILFKTSSSVRTKSQTPILMAIHNYSINCTFIKKSSKFTHCFLLIRKEVLRK